MISSKRKNFREKYFEIKEVIDFLKNNENGKLVLEKIIKNYDKKNKDTNMDTDIIIQVSKFKLTAFFSVLEIF